MEKELTEAIQQHQQGNFEQASSLYSKILEIYPNHFDALNLLGLVFLQTEQYQQAQKFISQAIQNNPNEPSFYNNLALVNEAQSDLSTAIVNLEQALKLNPDYAGAYHNLGNVQYKQGLFNEAIISYKKSLEKEPNSLAVLAAIGDVASQTGQIDMSIEYFNKALAINPTDVILLSKMAELMSKTKQNKAIPYLKKIVELEPNAFKSLTTLGEVLTNQRDYDQALHYLKQALALKPSNLKALIAIGNVFIKRHQYIDAIDFFQQAVQSSPNSDTTITMLGHAHLHQGNLDTAIEQYKKAIEINPNNHDPYTALGLALINKPDIEQGVSAFKQAKSRQFNANPASLDKFSGIPFFRAKHDLEQLEYLQQQNILANKYENYKSLLSDLITENTEKNTQLNTIIPLSSLQKKILSPSFNQIIYEDPGYQIKNSALNPDLDFNTIEKNYLQQDPQIIYIDDFLTPQALNAIRHYCLVSTIWKTNYRNGYLGAMQDSTFSFPLLYQIINELKNKLPKIFKNHLLYHSWGFKYDHRMHGIDVHADFAAVNINFWITANQANLDPNSGGLIIWDKSSPKDWNFQDYNNNSTKIMEYLQTNHAKAIKIPYRENRIVLFNSSLFHKTDDFNFREQYEHRRINITMLYGQALQF